MRKFAAIIALYACTILAGIIHNIGSASAHVLITDTTGKIGAILHVNPDDDPIAGKPSSLFYDIQSDTFLQHQHTVFIEITNEHGDSDGTVVTLKGSTVSTTYTFPAQGMYTITLTAIASDNSPTHSHTFTYVQRVSRGTLGSSRDAPSHQWATMLLTASASGFGVLVILFINHKTDITKYSKW